MGLISPNHVKSIKIFKKLRGKIEGIHTKNIKSHMDKKTPINNNGASTIREHIGGGYGGR